MKVFLLLTIIVLSFLSFGQGRVDGFFKGKGNLDIAFGASFEANPNYYAGTNLIKLQRNVLSVNAFFAYGITNKLDVNLSVPYVNVNGKVSGLQDPAVFLKYKLLHKSISNSTSIDVIIAGGFSSNITDYQTGGASALGQQAKTIDIRPVIQLNFPKGIFLTMQAGYNYKFDPVPNAVPFAAKLGMAKAKWYADIWYDGQHGIGGFDYQGTPTPPSFRELGVSYHKIGGTFYKPISSKLGWYGGLSYVLTGRNFSKGIGANLGLVFKPEVKK